MGKLKEKVIIESEESVNYDSFLCDQEEKETQKNKEYKDPVNFSENTFFNFMFNVVAGKYSGYSK